MLSNKFSATFCKKSYYIPLLAGVVSAQTAIVKPYEEACQAIFNFNFALPFKNTKLHMGDAYSQALFRLRQVDPHLVIKI